MSSTYRIKKIIYVYIQCHSWCLYQDQVQMTGILQIINHLNKKKEGYLIISTITYCSYFGLEKVPPFFIYLNFMSSFK